MTSHVTIVIGIIAFMSIALASLSNGQTTASGRTCSFSILNNKTFLDSLSEYFDKDSSTLILEYFLDFTNVGVSFDLTNRSSPNAFQPWRWFRTQGLGSSQLLLIYNYYYGLLKPFMTLSIERKDIRLSVNPTGCLNNYGRDALENLIRDFLLLDFNIDSKAAKRPFIYSDDVEICTAFIGDNNGWGRAVYKCCGFDADKQLYCHDVFSETWVWILDAFVIALTVLLFLYIPVFIPKGYKVDTYIYDSPKDLTFNVVITRQPEKYKDVATAQIVQPKIWSKMPSLKSKLSELQPDNVYTGKVKRADFRISMYKLFVEGDRTVHTRRYLFNAFIRCKLRHSAPLEECCKTPACGVYCCHRCPPWGSWLKAFRTIVAMTVLALPSLPFMYAVSADDLYYQELVKAYNRRGLQAAFNFYAGPYFGKVLVGVIATMYVLHGFILILDGATNNNISNLYADVLSMDEKTNSLRRRLFRAQGLIKAICGPIRKCGCIILPVWIIGALLSPIIVLVYFIWNSPMFRVLFQVFQKIRARNRTLKNRPRDKVRLYSRCELFWFFLTAIFAVIVLTIGANFLVHIAAMIVVTIVTEADLIYRILPVVLLLYIYIRDAYSKVGNKFDAFLATLISTINKSKVADDVRRECLKSEQEQKNKMFQITADDVVDGPSSDIPDTQSELLNEFAAKLLDLPLIRGELPTVSKSIFEIKNEQLIVRVSKPFVILSRDDFLHISKKFLFHCATIDCAGVPGTLGENYVNATVEFMKIGTFILFVFLVIMAYGSIYYISPTNHLFVTLVSGLVPLIIRNVFGDGSAVESVNASNYRFQAQLREKIDTFNQRWNLEDIDFEKFEKATFDVSNRGGVPTDESHQAPKIDLVLVMNDEVEVTVSKPTSPRRQRNEKVLTPYDDANSLMSSVQTHDLEMVPAISSRGAPGGGDVSLVNERSSERRSARGGTKTILADLPSMTNETERRADFEKPERAGERDTHEAGRRSPRRSRRSLDRSGKPALTSVSADVTSESPGHQTTL
ncbi:unnamed protein product [Lymnaea stagnalis]|uniref:Uncharacterized protein n=1 Tax=Lymnaea stagnalis TaxID=6523 RepID=A0AAV2I9C3_LYMST